MQPNSQDEYANVITLLSPMPYSVYKRWDNTILGDRGDEYYDFREKYSEAMIEFACQFYPHLRGCIEKKYTASPLTYRDYTSTPFGCAYGIVKDCRNPLVTFMPAKTRISNLLITGQNLNIHGCLGTTVSSAVTCSEILGMEYLLKMVEYAEKNNIDYNASSLKKAVCIGEALCSPDGELTTLGKRIREKWPSLELYSTYASTEMQSSFTECEMHQGGHIPSDLIIVEMLDENNQPVKDGESGEVTVTTIGVEGMPLVKFKTGDMCIRYSTPCKCGRYSSRLSSVIGRKGQMIKFKGTTIYPPILFDILDNIPDVDNYIVEGFTNSLGTDQIQIRIGSNNHSDAFVKQIKDIFRSKVRVAPDIQFESAELIARLQMPPMSRKVVKFFDLRRDA